jgi:alkanesulfonate monooxygenase SsuD/methylene tetrahydromethanopterin reductase-like flavin-dependent oxidoreductase (luciferase family)
MLGARSPKLGKNTIWSMPSRSASASTPSVLKGLMPSALLNPCWGGHPAPVRDRLRRDVAVWRHVYVGESHAEAEDRLADTLAHTRRHMLGARAAHNPEDYRVDPAVVNAFNDPSVPEDEAVRQSMAAGALYGTARQVAERLAELRDAGVRHVLCQMSFGYLGHERIVDSMRRFGEHVLPAFR